MEIWDPEKHQESPKNNNLWSPDISPEENNIEERPSRSLFSRALDYEKSLGLGMAQGVGDVGASVGNFPSWAIKNITGKEPYHIPHPDLRKYYANSLEGKAGGMIGEGISNLLPIGGAAMSSGSLLARLLKGALTGAVTSEENRPIGAAIGTGGALVPSLYRGGKKAYDLVNKPFKDVKEVEKLEDLIQQGLKNRSATQADDYTSIKKHLLTKQEKLAQDEERVKSEFERHFPEISESERLEGISNASKESMDKLEDTFNKRYQDFGQDHGYEPIFRPLEFEDFHAKIKDLKGLSSTLKEIKSDPSRKIYQFSDSAGNSHQLSIPNKGANVNDYVALMRELRDAAWDAKRSSKGLGTTYGEKMELLKTHKVLQDLKNDVENEIKSTIGKDAYKKFTDIQGDFEKTIGRFRNEPTLFNAAKKGKVDSSLFSDLMQPANKHIRDHLLKDPKYVEALKRYYLQGSKYPYQKEIPQEMYKLLSEPERAAYIRPKELPQERQTLKEIFSSVKRPTNLTALEEKTAREFSPEVNDFLNKSAHQKSITDQMEKEALKLGMTKQQLREQILTRKILLGIGVTTGILPPLTHKLKSLIFGGGSHD